MIWGYPISEKLYDLYINHYKSTWTDWWPSTTVGIDNHGCHGTYQVNWLPLMSLYDRHLLHLYSKVSDRWLNKKHQKTNTWLLVSVWVNINTNILYLLAPPTPQKNICMSISFLSSSLIHIDSIMWTILNIWVWVKTNNWMVNTKNWLCLWSPRSWILTHTHI